MIVDLRFDLYSLILHIYQIANSHNEFINFSQGKKNIESRSVNEYFKFGDGPTYRATVQKKTFPGRDFVSYKALWLAAHIHYGIKYDILYYSLGPL